MDGNGFIMTAAWCGLRSSQFAFDYYRFFAFRTNRLRFRSQWASLRKRFTSGVAADWKESKVTPATFVVPIVEARK